MNADFFHHFFGVASGQHRGDKIGLSWQLDPLFSWMELSLVAGIPVWKAYFLLIGFTALLK